MQAPTLIFDLGHVIVDVDFARFARAVTAGTDRAPDEALARFTAGEPKASLDRGLLGPQAFIAQLGAWLGPGALEHAALARAWADIFTLKPGAEATLARCRAAGPLWLLSDTDPLHFARALEQFSTLRSFDRYLLSYARGRLKRDPGAFDELGEQVRAGQRLVFIDDLEVNIAAASAAGVEAILFTGWDALQRDLTARGLVF